MDRDRRQAHRASRLDTGGTEFYCDIDAQFPSGTDISEIFIQLTSELQRFYPIGRALLVTREKNGTRFVATASFSSKKTRKNLALRLPSVSSLLEKVAETGTVYTEDCPEFFSGNSFERNLILDAESRSFALQPLKHAGRVVGLMAFSSDQETAFTVFEEGLLDIIAGQLAARIVATTAAPQTK